MWMLKLRGGVELTEGECQVWDNVPNSAEIEKLAFSIARNTAAPYIIEYAGFEEYCCSRIASAIQGADGRFIGYSVAVVKNGLVLEHDIFLDGMRLKLYPRDKCEIPDRCFRRGVPNV